jgi:hypothetical protein
MTATWPLGGSTHLCPRRQYTIWQKGTQLPDIVFSMRLTNADWDDTLHGWRCPPLAIPGAIVEALYIEGNRADTARYEVLKEQTIVRWAPTEQPQRVAATIRLTEDLALGTETDRWKRLAIVLPVVATILSAAISGGATYLSRDTHDGRSPNPIPTTTGVTPAHGSDADIDNTHISRAKALAFGQVGTGTAKTQSWFKYTIDGHSLKALHVLVRNPGLTGNFQVKVFDSNETEIRTEQAFATNIVLDLPSLRPATYYIAVGPTPFPGIGGNASRYEIVMTEQ